MLKLACLAALLAVTFAYGVPEAVPMKLNLMGMSNGHYGDPNSGACASGELNVTIQGLAGDFCSPSCSQSSPCPSDIPSGTSAQAECVLEMSGQTSPTHCALICQPGKDGQCPAKASCKPISSVGVCTYDS